jgi:hypothetical protein
MPTTIPLTGPICSFGSPHTSPYMPHDVWPMALVCCYLLYYRFVLFSRCFCPSNYVCCGFNADLINRQLLRGEDGGEEVETFAWESTVVVVAAAAAAGSDCSRIDEVNDDFVATSVVPSRLTKSGNAVIGFAKLPCFFNCSPFPVARKLTPFAQLVFKTFYLLVSLRKRWLTIATMITITKETKNYTFLSYGTCSRYALMKYSYKRPLSVIRGPFTRLRTNATGRNCPPITYINVMYDIRMTRS